MNLPVRQRHYNTLYLSHRFKKCGKTRVLEWHVWMLHFSLSESSVLLHHQTYTPPQHSTCTCSTLANSHQNRPPLLIRSCLMHHSVEGRQYVLYTSSKSSQPTSQIPSYPECLKGPSARDEVAAIVQSSNAVVLDAFAVPQ